MAEGEERFDNMFGEDFIEYGSRGDPELLLFILIIITPSTILILRVYKTVDRTEYLDQSQ